MSSVNKNYLTVRKIEQKQLKTSVNELFNNFVPMIIFKVQNTFKGKNMGKLVIKWFIDFSLLFNFLYSVPS